MKQHAFFFFYHLDFFLEVYISCQKSELVCRFWAGTVAIFPRKTHKGLFFFNHLIHHQVSDAKSFKKILIFKGRIVYSSLNLYYSYS